MKNQNDRRKNAVQILLSDDEQAAVGEAVKRLSQGRVSLSSVGRELLVSWASHVLRLPGRVFDGRCARCESEGATWWHRQRHVFYCEACGRAANEASDIAWCSDKHSPVNGWMKKNELREIGLERMADAASQKDPRLDRVVGALRDLIAEIESSSALPPEIAVLVANARPE